MKEKVKDNSDKIHPKESRSSENSKKNLKEKGDNTNKDSIGVNADNEVEKEREDLENENRKHSILESLKITLTNKNFVIFVLANMFTWFVMKLLTTIVPLYGIHVLGIGDGDLMLSILLMVALLSAAAFAPVMKKLSIKYGTRNAFIISSFIWLVSFIPFGFLDNRPYIALICMIFLGAGLSGAMVFVDIIISDVIDEDYVNTGLNRAGSYYGINALIHRYSTILVFVSISIVLSNYGWAEYIVGPEADFEALRSGLKLLMTVFPVAGLMIVILLLRKFDLHGKKLKNVQAQKREMEKQNQT